MKFVICSQEHIWKSVCSIGQTYLNKSWRKGFINVGTGKQEFIDALLGVHGLPW